MAYVSQELKAKIAPKIKAICNRYGVKASLSVRNHSTLVLNIRQGKIDFLGNYNAVVTPNNPVTTNIRVNPYWYHDHFDGVARDFLVEIMLAMNEGNYDNSDIQTDYFDRGWYTDVNIGRWDRPYALAA